MGIHDTSKALDRLSDQLLSGNAVFYIGAGFSIDSEQNTAVRLISRLVLRFMAMSAVMSGASSPLSNQTRSRVKAIARELNRVFHFPGSFRGPRSFRWEDLNNLAATYYEINDWFCSAYERLLCLMPDQTSGKLTPLLNLIHAQEEAWRADWPHSDPVPLTPMAHWLVQRAKERQGEPDPQPLAGKILFLDTQGFYQCPKIMGGEPERAAVLQTVNSYTDKLFERHHVLARFAREGWGTTLITTNFDRLLEGGYRLAGFERHGAPTKGVEGLPLPEWTTITSPVDFFSDAGTLRASQLIKLHGCAERYERLRFRNFSQLQEQQYLRSMVFTFREIQNWREDGWSRDLLRTLLRTKTMVFCCYSLRDPVIHDTLRSVYEEVARQKARLQSGRAAANADQGPGIVSFSSIEDGRLSREFHANEAIRAGTLASTGRIPAIEEEHPDQVGYEYRGGDRFSNLDDLFLWLNHLAYRRRQLVSLRDELRSVCEVLVNPKPKAELDGIVRAFEDLIEREKRRLSFFQQATWMPGPTKRQAHSTIVRWSYEFHPALLREFACLDAVTRAQGPGSGFRTMRALDSYYYPMAARSNWVAWGVVVEMALRGLVAVHAIGAHDRYVYPARANRPTINYGEKSIPLPHELSIDFNQYQRYGRRPKRRSGVRSRVVWQLTGDRAPWRRNLSKTPALSSSGGLLRMPVPIAGEIYDWALVGAGLKTKRPSDAMKLGVR